MVDGSKDNAWIILKKEMQQTGLMNRVWIYAQNHFEAVNILDTFTHHFFDLSK